MKLILTFLSVFLLHSTLVYAVTQEQVAARVLQWLNQSSSNDFKLKNAKEAGLSGFSGDPVLLIQDKNGQLVFVAKAFTGDSRLEHFRAELESAKFLKSLGLRKSDIVDMPYSAHEPDFELLIMKAAKGNTFRDHLRTLSLSPTGSTKRSHALSQAKTAAFRIGQALAELNFHTKPSITRLEKDTLTRYTEQFELAAARIEKARDEFPEFDTAKTLMERFKSFEKNLTGVDYPNLFGYLHGDAFVGNVMYDTATDAVTLIDLSKVINFISPEGLPKGLISYEFHKFLYSIPWTNKMDDFNIPSQELTELMFEYSRGYRQNIAVEQISPNADQLFKFLWQMRLVAFYVKKYKEIQHTESSKGLRQEILEIYRSSMN